MRQAENTTSHCVGHRIKRPERHFCFLIRHKPFDLAEMRCQPFPRVYTCRRFVVGCWLLVVRSRIRVFVSCAWVSDTASGSVSVSVSVSGSMRFLLWLFQPLSQSAHQSMNFISFYWLQIMSRGKTRHHHHIVYLSNNFISQLCDAKVYEALLGSRL